MVILFINLFLNKKGELKKLPHIYFNQANETLNRLSDPFNRKQYKLKKLLWKAHGDSITYSLWRNYNKLKNNGSEEWYFWANWTYFVYYLEKFNFSTYARIIQPIKNIFMPVCYPLDSSLCYNSLNPLKKIYVDIFTRKNISLNKIFQKFTYEN